MQVEDLDCHFNKCAVSSCKEEFFQPNDEGALDLITQGGYGDFMDYIEDPPVYFKLCHYHGHKLASKVNNPAIHKAILPIEMIGIIVIPLSLKIKNARATNAVD